LVNYIIINRSKKSLECGTIKGKELRVMLGAYKKKGREGKGSWGNKKLESRRNRRGGKGEH